MEQVKRNNTYYHQKEADYERKYTQASYYKHYVKAFIYKCIWKRYKRINEKRFKSM